MLDLEIPSLRALQKDLWRDTFRHDIEQYLKSLGQAAPVKNLQAIIDSGRFHQSIAKPLSRSLQAPVPNDLEAAYSADPADDPARRELRRRVLAMMNEHKVDALIFPTWNNPPRRIGDLKSPHGNNSPFIAPHTGQPAITVPMGFTRNGLPTGPATTGPAIRGTGAAEAGICLRAGNASSSATQSCSRDGVWRHHYAESSAPHLLQPQRNPDNRFVGHGHGCAAMTH